MKEILEAFGIKGKPEKLIGGQGRSVRIANYVVKPIEEIAKYSWAGSILESISDTELCLSKPLRSKNGNFVEGGYGITFYIEGVFRTGRIKQKIAVCKALNLLLKSVEQPPHWHNWYSAWQWGHRVAWEEADLPSNTDGRSSQIIETIKKNYQPINLSKQLIHSDLAGNILFNYEIPIIIDFSPEFRPAIYAEILLITDSIAWHNEPIESLWITDYPKALVSQLALRAIVFRLAVVIILYPDSYIKLLEEMKNFQALLNILKP